MVDSGLSGSNETSYSSGACSTPTGTEAPSSYATPPETEALRRLSDGLESIFERPRAGAGAGSSFSDAAIVAGDGREVPVHLCVLAARSPFFGAAFAGSESGARLELAEVFGVSSFLGVLPFFISGEKEENGEEEASHFDFRCGVRLVKTGRKQGSGSFAFLEVNDGSCPMNLQAIVDSAVADLGLLVPTGTCVALEGVLKVPRGDEAED
ncbi:hypothetical protein NL676_009395 [Syzygium grande]|nr:hypothetical protein NL676_009395 [Syzygium grande]